MDNFGDTKNNHQTAKFPVIYRIGQKFGKFGEFYQITKLYLPNILQFNYYCQYFNVFAKLYSPN